MMWLWIILSIWAAVAVLILSITICDEWNVRNASTFGEKFTFAACWPLVLVMAVLDRP